MLYCSAVFGRKRSAHEKTQILFELCFGFHADDDTVDPALASCECQAQISRVLAVVIPSKVRQSPHQRGSVYALHLRPETCIACEKSLQIYAARMHGNMRAGLDARNHAAFTPAPVQDVERQLDMLDIGALEGRKSVLRCLDRNTQHIDRSVFEQFDQAVPNRAVMRRHVRGAMEKQTVDSVSLQGGERCRDAFVNGGASFAPGSIRRQLRQWAEFGDGADVFLVLECLAQTLFTVAIGPRGVDAGYPGIQCPANQSQCRSSRRFPGTVCGATGKPKLHGAEHKFRGHASTAPCPRPELCTDMVNK